MPHDTTAPAAWVLAPDAARADDAPDASGPPLAPVALQADNRGDRTRADSRNGGDDPSRTDVPRAAAPGIDDPAARLDSAGLDAGPAPERGGPLDPERSPMGKEALADQRQAARAAWRAEPTLTGAALAARFGRKPRWGREQIAAARRDRQPAHAAGTPTAAHISPGTGHAAPLNANGPRTPGRGTPPPDSGTRGAPGGAPRPGHRTGPAQAGTPPAASGAAVGTAEAASRAGRRDERATPSALLGMTVVSVALVTVVCAVVSYSHARHLAELAGQGGLAPWLPLAVDGLVAAATCSLLVDRRRGERGHPLGWLGAGLGLAGSFGANLVAVDPALVDVRHVRWVLAGYVPAALAISGHLLMRMLGEPRSAAPPDHP